MGSMRQRHKVLEAVVMTMMEQGKVLSRHEYEQLGMNVQVRSGIVMNHFGSWSRLLRIIENTMPEEWEEIKRKENPPPPPPPKPAPKVEKPEPKPAPAPKPVSVAEPKPAPKPAAPAAKSEE
jgi:outer membrane biosynthesis protein TonB